VPTIRRSRSELVDRSGLRELEQVLHTQFTERRDVLKARRRCWRWTPCCAGDGTGQRRGPLAREIDRILAGRTSSPSCGCSGACAAAPSPCPPATPTTASGCWATPAPSAPARLGLAPDDAATSSGGGLRRARRWQRHSVNPMLGRAATDAAGPSCAAARARRRPPAP
jgi:hypothetical protein